MNGPAPTRRVLAAFLFALAGACAHGGQRASPLRFDGLYVSEDAGAAQRSYLRFYPDGSLAMANISGQSTPEEVARWLSPSHPFSAHGSYDVRLDRLSMSVIARTPAPDGPTPAGATSYQGLIRGEELQLDRGGAGEVVLATYRFTPVSFPG